MAQNRIHDEGRKLRIAVASTVKADDPVLINEMVGVALTDYASSDGAATIAFDGVFDLSVKGVNDAGNVAVAVGDALYYVVGDTPVLSKKSSGVFFGYALEAITSGGTDTIKVRLPYSSGSNRATGLFVSTEQTGTGSSQNVAHGLGVIPSKVIVVPTEFTSSMNYDAAEGTHTITNVVVTVTSGAKFKVVAYK